ncbi:hypothetical protein PV328_001159 [Microctonus aethiopoides]|uniref:Uncharacterized protein n=1 Tax=Microctonus aethiopoides TaxID=144406 RepID=A0AA39FX38_9HYME|nr:hypothetical protein PV328_001159 [Microctonus aethiopoides]
MNSIQSSSASSELLSNNNQPLNTASDSSLNPLPPSNVSLANEATVSDSNAASETSDEDDDISECDYNGVLWGLIPHLSLTENLVQLVEHLAKSLRKAYDKEKLKNSNLPTSQVAAEYFEAKDTKRLGKILLRMP